MIFFPFWFSGPWGFIQTSCFHLFLKSVHQGEEHWHTNELESFMYSTYLLYTLFNKQPALPPKYNYISTNLCPKMFGRPPPPESKGLTSLCTDWHFTLHISLSPTGDQSRSPSCLRVRQASMSTSFDIGSYHTRSTEDLTSMVESSCYVALETYEDSVQVQVASSFCFVFSKPVLNFLKSNLTPNSEDCKYLHWCFGQYPGRW